MEGTVREHLVTVLIFKLFVYVRFRKPFSRAQLRKYIATGKTYCENVTPILTWPQKLAPFSRSRTGQIFCEPAIRSRPLSSTEHFNGWVQSHCHDLYRSHAINEVTKNDGCRAVKSKPPARYPPNYPKKLGMSEVI